MKKPETLKITTNLKSLYYEDKEIQNLISYNYICMNILT